MSFFFLDNCNWFHVYMKVVPSLSNSFYTQPNLILDINVVQRLIKEEMTTFTYYTIYSQGSIISKYQYWNKKNRWITYTMQWHVTQDLKKDYCMYSYKLWEISDSFIHMKYIYKWSENYTKIWEIKHSNAKNEII